MSYTSTETVSGPVGVRRARSTEAPTACRETPCQAKGRWTFEGSSIRPPGPIVWSTASSSAGWTPNAAASACACSGRATSAYTSWPLSGTRTVRMPRNTGPYASPASERVSYIPVRSASRVPGGGHSRRAGGAVSWSAGARTPVACRVHSAVPSGASGRE